jgi:hypothetical protein
VSKLAVSYGSKVLALPTLFKIHNPSYPVLIPSSTDRLGVAT